jgi:hypothetical protein
LGSGFARTAFDARVADRTYFWHDTAHARCPFVFVFFFRFAERRFLFGQQFSDVLSVCRIDHGFEHFLKVLDIFSVNEAVHNLSFPGSAYYFAALR